MSASCRKPSAHRSCWPLRRRPWNLVATGAGVLIFLLLHFLKSLGGRLCKRDATGAGWYTVFGRAIAKFQVVQHNLARLAGDDVWVLPGSVAQLPGRFRISLTANDGMVERSLPVFARAIRQAAA